MNGHTVFTPYFPQHRYKTVLVADRLCPTATANTVCTATTNDALQSVIDAIDSIQFPPDFSVPNVFYNLRNFMSWNLNIINILSMEPIINVLRPVYNWLTQRRCFSLVVTRYCFRITDIFDNWLVRFVSGIIDSFLRPLLNPIRQLFQGLALPSLPSLSLPQPNWAVPGFSIDFDVGRLNLQCLAYDYSAQAVQPSCFDFPSLNIPTPFISNPLSFACDEGCDTACNAGCNTGCDTGCDDSCDGSCDSSCNGGCDDSCDSSCDFLGQACDSSCDHGCDTCYGSCNHYCDSDCDLSCNTGCNTACNTACDSSCDFVATCGSSGRRLEDSSDAISAEPKAIGWSERLAAAAAQEGK